MASVLKKEKDNTIKGTIQQYFAENTMIVLCIFLSCMIITAMIIMEYQQENSSLLRLNDFYEQMKENDSLLFHYVFSNVGEGEEELLDHIAQTAEILEEIQNSQVSETFYRDVDDIRNIYSGYYESAKQMIRCNQEKKNITEIYQMYESSEKRIELMEAGIQSLYAQQLRRGKERMEYRRKQLMISIVTLVLCIVAGILRQYLSTRKLSQKITAPIVYLTDEVHKIEKHGMDSADVLAVVPESNAEIKGLTEMYNSMLQTIRRQIRDREEYMKTELRLQEEVVENLKISNELKKMQYYALQMQINPHFLFNTLNMISQTAMMEQGTETVELIGCTAEYLRYSLDYADRAVPLQKEIEELGNYIYIQEKRFGDRICVRFDLDESFGDTIVPSMILQPLVENAVVHGVGMYEKDARIDIITRRSADGKNGMIVIRDNGVGMTQGQLDRLREQVFDRTKEIEKIGLHNVWKRLQIFFNCKVPVEICSEPGRGTEITICLPLENR